MDLRLPIVNKPDSVETVIFEQPVGNLDHFMKGEGNLNLLCGSCDFVLCKALMQGQIEGIVFKCPQCGNYNSA
jgi:hypothetical protein